MVAVGQRGRERLGHRLVHRQGALEADEPEEPLDEGESAANRSRGPMAPYAWRKTLTVLESAKPTPERSTTTGPETVAAASERAGPRG